MTKISNIDKAAMIMLRPRIDAALAELGKEFGLSLHAGNGSFSGREGHFKLMISVDDPEIQAKADREEFDRYCYSYGLRPDDFGTRFYSGGKTFEVIGLNMRGRKSPIKARRLDDGKTYIFSSLVAAAIREATEAAKATA